MRSTPRRFAVATALCGSTTVLFPACPFDRTAGATTVGFGANFGSGSSREQAVWALHGLGVRAVIAPALVEIFHNNCLRNGIVPVILPPEQVAEMLASAAAGVAFTVDLEAQTVTVGNARPVPFDISPERRLALLNGWDETDLVLARFADDIAAFEAGQRKIQPWLYPEETTA